MVAERKKKNTNKNKGPVRDIPAAAGAASAAAKASAQASAWIAANGTDGAGIVTLGFFISVLGLVPPFSNGDYAQAIMSFPSRHSRAVEVHSLLGVPTIFAKDCNFLVSVKHVPFSEAAIRPVPTANVPSQDFSDSIEGHRFGGINAIGPYLRTKEGMDSAAKNEVLILDVSAGPV